MKVWEYNVLKLNPPNSNKLCFIAKFIEEWGDSLVGDYAEFGVFKGSSFLTISYLISSLNSSRDKLCWGYDTFGGFPENLRVDPRDNPQLFNELYEQKRIDEDHFLAVNRLQELRKYQLGSQSSTYPLTHQELSTSKNFEVEGSISHIQQVSKFLGLNNIRLIQGEFNKTLEVTGNLPDKIFCGLLDVDLYQSYKDVLNRIWHKVVPQGRIYLDEYYSLKFPGPKYFIDEFVESNSNCELCLAGSSGDFERWYIEKISI